MDSRVKRIPSNITDNSNRVRSKFTKIISHFRFCRKVLADLLIVSSENAVYIATFIVKFSILEFVAKRI